MNSRTRRWIQRTVAVLALLSLVLASCQAPVEPNAAQPAQSSETNAAPAADGTITLNVWDFGGVEFEWMETIAIPAWEKEHPNIKIVHLGVPETDYATKLETAVAAGDVPDLALQSYTYRFWQAGHVAPLDDYFQRDGFKLDDFYPLFQSWCMLDGKIYCMPVNAYIWAMLYNKDLFSAAGLPELTTDTVITYQDWLGYARAINKPAETLEDRVWGSVHFPPNWNAMNNNMSDPYVLGADGRTCTDNSESEAWISTWQALLDAHNEDLTTETAGAMLGSGDQDPFNLGKLGMTYGTLGNARQAQTAGINVGLTGQPVVTEGWQGNVGSWADGYAMMKATAHPDEAWEFLKFLTTEVAPLRADGDCDSCGNPAAYRPAAANWAGDDPLKQDAQALLDRVVPPPFSPDIWTSVDPFYEAWRRMTEDGTPVAEAVHDAAVECQETTDDLWKTWASLAE